MEFGTYFDGRTAITLVKENGEPVEVTVDLPELGMPVDSVFIEDSMVDEGVVEALQEADVLSFKITSVDHQGAVVSLYALMRYQADETTADFI